MAHVVADAIVRRHLKTMWRLSIEYDLLPWESDILRLQFWATAFELLKERERHLPGDRGQERGLLGDAAARPLHGRDATRPRTSKVIVRSNGTVTYVGKDIAYQFWKFGLLGKDFHYRPFDDATRTGTQLWVDHRRSRSRAQRPPSAAARGLQRDRRRASRTCRTSWWPACAALGYHGAGRAVDPLLLRDGGALAAAAAPSWASRSPRRTRSGRTSRCPAARAWA